MFSNVLSSRTVSAFAMAAALLAPAPTVLAQAPPAEIVIVNINAPGVGFNDPTPAAPVGENPGTTLGEQRLNAFRYAAELWGRRISSPVPIRIRAQFTPLGTGILGSAGPVSVVRDFANAPLPGTWYHVALANALAGVDLLPSNDDINANFSTNFNFYLGLDNKAPATQNDLVAVLLHEFAHGLGFSQFASITPTTNAQGQIVAPPSGALFAGFPDVYNSRLLDTPLGRYWSQLTNAERVASSTRFGRVVLDAPRVTSAVPSVLRYGTPTVAVLSPTAVAGVRQFGGAAFGPAIGSPDVQSTVVAAVDPAEPLDTMPAGTTTDGCSPFANAAQVAGNIALIERGRCGFAVKARNATEAGATAVIIYNNAANLNAAPPSMADDGVNGAFVTIPTVSVTRADGLGLLAEPSAVVRLAVDQTLRAGADALDRARVFAPFPVVGGSSISHYDSIASRNLLMEPSINRDLTHNLKAPFDLTSELFYDLGWRFPDADGDGVVDDEDCNPNSIVTATLVINGIDTGVPNKLFATGCTMADVLASTKVGTLNHGQYVSAVAQLTNQWVAGALITGAQKGRVQSAVGRSN